MVLGVALLAGRRLRYVGLWLRVADKVQLGLAAPLIVPPDPSLARFPPQEVIPDDDSSPAVRGASHPGGGPRDSGRLPIADGALPGLARRVGPMAAETHNETEW